MIARPRRNQVRLRTAMACHLVAILVLNWTLGWTRPTVAAPIPSEPVFTGLLIDGQAVSGRIVAIGRDTIALESMEQPRQEIPLARLVKLYREIPVVPAAAEGSHVLFPEGDRLMRVVVGAATETSLDVQSYALGKLSVPLESLLGLVLSPPTETEAFDNLWERVRMEPRSSEVIWLANGDRMTGGFLGLDDRIIKFQLDGKPVEVDRAGVIALGFDPALAAYTRPKSDFVEVKLTDGTRLGVTDARIEQGHVLATTRFGQAIRFPINDLVRLDARSSTVVYLSEREVAAQQYVPYVGPTRPFRIDRTVDGHRFQLGGRAYERGLGTQSRTLLAFRLKPGDRRFQALVGLDERAGALGNAVVRVLVDGQTRFTSPPMTSRDQPRAIDIDVSGAKLLILVTEFSDRGNVRDFVDWVEARIIR